MTASPEPMTTAVEVDRFRRRTYKVLWVLSLVVCPVATWVVGIVATIGPRPDDGFGLREVVVNPEYIFGVHVLLSCFAAWAAFTVWGRWWLVGWGAILLAGLVAVVVHIGVALSIFYG
jgi:hypothetical protein